MALQMPFGKRTMVIIENLVNGSARWDDLSFEEKYLVYSTRLDLTDTVDPKKVNRFEAELERRKALEEDQGAIERVVNRMSSALPK